MILAYLISKNLYFYIWILKNNLNVYIRIIFMKNIVDLIYLTFIVNTYVIEFILAKFKKLKQCIYYRSIWPPQWTQTDHVLTAKCPFTEQKEQDRNDNYSRSWVRGYKWKDTFSQWFRFQMNPYSSNDSKPSKLISIVSLLDDGNIISHRNAKLA